MKRMILAVVTAVTVISFGRTAEPMNPAIEIRVQSVAKLVDYAGYIGDLIGQQEQFEQYGNAVKAFAGKKGIEGFDIKRPFGLYGEISKDVHDSPLILLIPVADSETATKAITTYLKLELKSVGNGISETALPNVPLPLFIRFQNGYLQATLGSKTNFDRAITTKAFFGTSFDSIADVKLHVDRIPADVRKVLLGQVEFQLQKEKDRVKESERSAGKRAFAGFILDGTAAALKTLLDDTKTISLNLSAKTEDDLVRADLRLVPKAKSDLAGMIANAGKKSSSTNGRIQADNPIMRMNINVALTESQRKKFEPVVDDVLNEAEGGVDAFVADLVKKFFASIEPTMKSGDLDFAALIDGPETNGKNRLNMMLKMKKGLDLVDTMVEASKIIPAGIIEPKFDIEKIDGQKLHTFTIHENPGKLEELFGSAAIWAGTSDQLFALGFEADGKMLKSALASKPSAGKIADVDFAVGRLAVMVAEDDKKDAMKKAVKAIGVDNSQSDRIRLSIEGGSELAISLTAKGKALKVFMAIDRVNKK